MTGRLDAVPRCPVCRALAETKTPLQAGRAEIRQRNRTKNLGAEPAQASQPPTDGDVVRRLSLATHLWFFSFLEASSECLSRGSCHRSPLHAFFRPFIPRPRRVCEQSGTWPPTDRAWPPILHHSLSLTPPPAQGRVQKRLAVRSQSQFHEPHTMPSSPRWARGPLTSARPHPGLAPGAGISTVATWSSGGVPRGPLVPPVCGIRKLLCSQTRGGSRGLGQEPQAGAAGRHLHLVLSDGGPGASGLPGTLSCHPCGGGDCVCPVLSRRPNEKGGGKLSERARGRGAPRGSCRGRS